MEYLAESFSNYLNEELLLELSSNSTLYHRSPLKLKVGDSITPRLNKKGEHWLKSNIMEILLDEYRKQNTPNKPSRFTSIYTTPIPRGRFVDKGYLYVVKPVGNFHMTDSTIIDQMQDEWTRSTMGISSYSMDDFYEDIKRAKTGDKKSIDELMYYFPTLLASRYWTDNQRVSKNNINNIEILCESVIVTEVVEDNRLKRGNKVEVIQKGSVVIIEIQFNEPKSKIKFTDTEMNSLLDNLEKKYLENAERNLIYSDENDDGTVQARFRIKGELKLGKKFKVLSTKSSLYNYDDYDNQSKFKNIDLDLIESTKLDIRRFQLNDIYNKGYDISRFFKII